MFTDSRTEPQPLQANLLGLLLIKASEMDRMKKVSSCLLKNGKMGPGKEIQVPVQTKLNCVVSCLGQCISELRRTNKIHNLSMQNPMCRSQVKSTGEEH